MRLKLFAFLAFACVLSPSILRAEDSCDGPLLPPASKVLLIGDSLGVGLGPQFKKLAKLAGYIPVVHAVNGSTTMQWTTWVKDDLRKHKPSLVVVSLGTNDAVLGVESLRKNRLVYAELVDEVSATGAAIAWVGPPKLDPKKVPYAGDARDIISGIIDAPYYESHELEFPRAVDKIHSTPGGYRIWMNAVWEWLVQQGIVR